jgi:outer membrane cobalamin receptor
MKNILLLFLLIINSTFVISQIKIKGKVVFEDSGISYPIGGSSIYWQGTQSGTISNDKGEFEIQKIESTNNLVISYIGFKTQIIQIENDQFYNVVLVYDNENELEDVTVTKKINSVQRSYILPQNVVRISEQELLNAACCNLSESFETNPAIDVNHSDAITGTKQINMLGLKSPYILITEENVPMVRGASQTYGLGFTPGPWIESIQVTKGMGSVVNGFESIVGQINTELKKPLTDIPLLLNLFNSNSGRVELNTQVKSAVSEKISTSFFAHYNKRDQSNDKNSDGFLDKPLQSQINLINRWQYTNAAKGLVSFFNIRVLDDLKKIGQIGSQDNTSKWGGRIKTNRFDTSFKLGYVNPNIPYQTIGFQLAYNIHDQDSYYGTNIYDINQKSLFSNFLYNSIITNAKNKIKVGINYSYDAYDEFVYGTEINRTDKSFASFIEYSYDNLNNLNLVLGLRYDIHNNMGSFFTPRVHLRYMLNDNLSIKGSYGKGRKIANVFAENQQIFFTNRVIQNKSFSNYLYGVNPELATNYGFSIDQKISFLGGQGNLIFDYYSTRFDNKVIIDFEKFGEFNFYNSIFGNSVSNSSQLEFVFSKNNWNLTAAYKTYDVNNFYKDGLKEKPLQPKNIIFFNYGIESNRVGEKLWKFNFTYNRLGKQRLMQNIRDKEIYVKPHYSINSQITRVFSNKFEVYLGGENINNFKQDNPIIMASNPYSSDFDASIIHGPVFGSTYYMGLRFKILN